MATKEQLLAAVHGYVAGFAAGDAEAITALFAPDATVEDPVGTPIREGSDAIRAFYASSVATGAKLELSGDPRCAGDFVAFPFRVLLHWNGTDSAIEVIDTFRLNEAGKITEMRAYWGPDNMKQA
jgi:steroid Delta-isomerase